MAIEAPNATPKIGRGRRCEAFFHSGQFQPVDDDHAETAGTSRTSADRRARSLVRHAHPHVWLGAVATTGGPAFIILFTLESLARSIVITVLPLQALALLGDAQAVSVLYFSVSAGALVGSLSVPWLVGLMRRRWVLTLGALCVAFSAPFLASQTVAGIVIGLMMHFFGAAAYSICINLFILDHIQRKAFARFEPLRMLFGGIGWMVGPALGVYLGNHVAVWLPYAASAGLALAGLGYFWFLRVTDNPALARGAGPPPNPLLFVRRYFAQPRLALAWILAAGRAGWWGMFFIYAPIYAVTVGFSEEASGLLVSAGAASMFLVTFWGWVGRRYGIRRLLVGGYAVTGLLTLAIGAAAGVPWLGVALIVAAAFGASVIDGAGNVPFLRAVRPLERAEMTTVFSTYRDLARLSMPGVFSLVLQTFALPAVFLTGGFIMMVLTATARFIPRRL